MKTASINELRQELLALPPAQLADLCLRLARFKKDNKELLTYLLFEASDQETYIHLVKDYMDEEFTTIPPNSLYIIKKMLRRILKTVNKYIRYTGDKQAEIELLTYFCKKITDMGIVMEKGTALYNLLQQQIRKIEKTIDTQHEDLQYDYRKALQLAIG